MSERMVFTDLMAVSMSDKEDKAPAEVETVVEVWLNPKAPRVMAFTVIDRRSVVALERVRLAIEQGHAVVRSRVRNTGDFAHQLPEFLIRIRTFGRGHGIGGALDGEFAHALQDVVDFSRGAFRDLNQGDAVLGITLGAGHAADFAAQGFGNREAGGIIRSAVDAETGGELLQGLAQGALLGGQRTLADHRGNVVIDSHRKNLRVDLDPGILAQAERCCRSF
jgi:hypothetical protein